MKKLSIPVVPHVLRNKQFIKLWLSQLLTITGLNIVNFVLLLQLFNKTNSTLAASFLWIAYSIPILLVGPFASTVADIVNRKKLLVITTLLQSLTILLFLFTGDRYFLLYTILFVYSLISQFYLPSESATLPALVTKEELPEANGLFLLTKQAGMLIGFGSAGFLSKFLGFHPTLILCSILLAIACISVASLPKMSHQRRLDIETDLTQFFSKVLDGYRYIKNNKQILYPILLVAGGEIIMYIIAINIPALVKELLNIAVEDAALYIIIPALVGAMLGVYIFPKILRKQIRKILIIRTAILGLALCFLAIGVFLPLVSIEIRPFLLPIICFMTGISFVGVQIPSQTLMQEVTPPDMMGRLWGNLWFLMTIATIIPMFLSASITEVLGAHTFFALLGGIISMVYLMTLSKIHIDHLPKQ